MKLTSRHLHQVRGKFHKGLTLLELVVVLTILAAIGGILLPLLPNLLTKTHVAVCTTNIPELNKAMITFNASNFTQPTRFDNLANGAAVWAGVPFSAVAAYTSAALTAGQADSLIAAGITNMVQPLTTAGLSPTFAAHSVPNGAVVKTIASADTVLTVTKAALNVALGGGVTIDPANTRYVIFGVGQASTLVGEKSGIFEAPVHFSDNAVGNPNNAYGRYFVVYRVLEDGSPAEFVGAAAPNENGLEGVNSHLAEF